MKFYHLVIFEGLLALFSPKAAVAVVFLTGIAAIVAWMFVLAGAGRKRQ
ncbi:hypothetical protein [Pseudomonas citronellolis]|nr:hypothetical protein [Pseudomonas citronellolis]MDF3931398.1 hypothetical protein [Pseudomonas citronellolis]